MLKWFTKKQSFESTAEHQKQEEHSDTYSASELTAADYDFLFNQLLDGVAHGWNQFKVIKFFQNLETRGNEEHWVTWLEKFSAKIPDTPNDSQRRLGAIMLRLAEVTQSTTELSQLSAVSSKIGKQLFFGNSINLIWEYDGLDIINPAKTNISNTKSVQKEDINNSSEKIQTQVAQEQILESISKENKVVEVAEQKETVSRQLDTQVTTIKRPEDNEIIELELQSPENIQLKEPLNSIKKSSSVENITEEFTANHSIAEQEPLVQSKKPEPTTAKDGADMKVMELVESWFNLGLKQANAGDLSGAIESWNQALKLDPNLAEIWHNLGSALGRLEHYPEAINSFNHALEIAPQSEYAWNDRAHAFYQMQQWDQAMESWNQAISINPSNHQFWYHYGSALEQLQRLDEAIASYAKALEISPDFQPARSKYTNLIKES